MTDEKHVLIILRVLMLCSVIVAAAPVAEDDFELCRSFNAGYNYLIDHPPSNQDSSINIVVEIPAGTTAKWEVSESGAELKWESKNGSYRIIRYLPYPGNYGMIPQTLLPEQAGGDGDPLDVIVLGPAVQRGSLIQAKLIGVLRLLDDGEWDDKLIAVPLDSAMWCVDDISELREEFPGVATIIETWFCNYKGKGRIESQGFAEREVAWAILRNAAGYFQELGSEDG